MSTVLCLGTLVASWILPTGTCLVPNPLPCSGDILCTILMIRMGSIYPVVAM